MKLFMNYKIVIGIDIMMFFCIISIATIITSCVKTFGRGNNKTATTFKSHIKALPFGSQILVDYKFTKTLKIPIDEELTGPQKHSRQQEKLSAILGYFGRLGEVPPIAPPEISNYKQIKFGEDSLTISDKSSFKGDFKYQLPGIGKYQVYYCQHENYDYDTKRNPFITKDNRIYLSVGRLVLYNQLDKTAQVLNIYYSYTYNEANYALYRLFFIDKNATIKVFEANLGDGNMGVRLAQIIIIKTNGKISIRNIK